jgi:hypothetical protein
MFLAFLEAKFAEFDFERADHEFSVVGMIAETAKMRNGAVGTLDVKIHCIETSDDFAKCVWFWLEYTPRRVVVLRSGLQTESNNALGITLKPKITRSRAFVSSVRSWGWLICTVIKDDFSSQDIHNQYFTKGYPIS